MNVIPEVAGGIGLCAWIALAILAAASVAALVAIGIAWLLAYAD